MRPNGTVTVWRLRARKRLAQHDLPSIVYAMRLEPALRDAEPDRDNLRRLSLLRSATAAINDAATWLPPARVPISLLKGHVGMAPVRKRNFGQLHLAVRLVHDRVAELKWLDEGNGVKRYPVMYNDFCLLYTSDAADE